MSLVTNSRSVIVYVWEVEKETTVKSHRNILKMLGIFPHVDLVFEVITRLYTMIKIHQNVHLNECVLVHVNYISKWGRGEVVKTNIRVVDSSNSMANSCNTFAFLESKL